MAVNGGFGHVLDGSDVCYYLLFVCMMLLWNQFSAVICYHCGHILPTSFYMISNCVVVVI